MAFVRRTARGHKFVRSAQVLEQQIDRAFRCFLAGAAADVGADIADAFNDVEAANYGAFKNRSKAEGRLAELRAVLRAPCNSVYGEYWVWRFAFRCGTATIPRSIGSWSGRPAAVSDWSPAVGLASRYPISCCTAGSTSVFWSARDFTLTRRMAITSVAICRR